jgi:hypothetical protein
MAEQSHLEKLQNLRNAMVEKRRASVDAIIERGGLNKTFLHDASLYREIISLQDIVEGLDRVIVDERNSPALPTIESDIHNLHSPTKN